jgi:pyruvate dehydrogenase E2 component (dihydrolipoamide acetyltransferase)
VAELQTITLPALGDFDDIEIIEVLIVSGDVIEAEDPIIILESDKASMEIPSPYSGKVMSVHINVGDRISEGTEIAKLEVAEVKLDEPTPTEAEPAPAEIKPAPAEIKPAPAESKPAPPVAKASEAMPTVEVAEAKSPEEHKIVKPASVSPVNQVENRSAKLIHASPSIRRHARELGVNLELVIATGAKGRILKEDVKAFIKASLSAAPTSGGATVSAMPTIDFSKFGEIEPIPLSRIQKISGAHLLRSWVSVPHVTQFDEANITELEAFRKSLKSEAEKKGVRLTPLVFMMKAVVAALQEFPRFNASLENSGERLILKKYFHIGVAVDTPNGLMVPVIRDVDKKGLYDLAAELASTAERARNGKLLPADMQGGCFTISSLGGIGGTNFTPIVNAPEVAILGVAKAKMQPVYEADGSFSAGLILPLALSYDHRVIDGAQGAKFTSFLSQVMTDIRRVLL